MNRRGFIRALFQGAAYIPLAPFALMATPPRRVIVQQSPVAGFQYHQGENVFHCLRANVPLRLVRETENKYDRGAVAVYFKAHKLGFVPRADNTAIAQMLDNGESLSARIINLEQSKNPWDRIRFEVTLNG